MPIFVAATVVVAVAAALAMTPTPDAAAVQSPNPYGTEATIRYQVAGSANAAYIVFQTNNGQERLANVTLPWSTEFTGFRKQGERMAINYIITAQSVGAGSLTCTLLVNGTVMSENSATGDPARVACEHH